MLEPVEADATVVLLTTNMIHMDFKTKRKYKRKARMYYRLATLMILLFVLTIVLAATGVMTVKTVNVIVPISMLISSVAFGMGFTGMGQNYSGRRIDYIRRIRLRREYAFFHRVINMTVAGEFENAVDTYNRENSGKSGVIKDHLFSFITGAAVFSGDEDRRRKGLKNLSRMLECFDPAKVEL